jgi:hypothetical protein
MTGEKIYFRNRIVEVSMKLGRKLIEWAFNQCLDRLPVLSSQVAKERLIVSINLNLTIWVLIDVLSQRTGFNFIALIYQILNHQKHFITR